MKLDTLEIGSSVETNYNLLKSLFQTDLFLGELDRARDLVWGCEPPHNLVVKVMAEMLRKPLVVFEYDDYDLESSHFTSMMGMIGKRSHYTNPYVNDLYYLHEIAHAATMPYGKAKNIQEFHRMTGLNELFAATLTEVYVYKLYPELRQKTFDFPIWVDEYMTEDFQKNESFSMKDFGVNYEDTVFIWWVSHRFSCIRNPNYLNLTEMQIAAYAEQNAAWTQVWAKSWKVVMDEMVSYHKAYTEASTSKEKSVVVDAHLSWIRSHYLPNDVTPFQREAEAFAVVLKDTKRRMGNIALFNKES